MQPFGTSGGAVRARLAERLRHLGRVAEGAGDVTLLTAHDPVLQRALRRVHGRWHDGDENLVRGLVERWQRGSGDASRERAAALLSAASALSAMGARREAVWFYLWEMESVIASLGAR